MKYKFIYSFIFLTGVLFSANAKTQGTVPPGGQTPQASQQAILKEIARVSAQTLSLQCDFVQTKSLPLLSEEMVSQGRLYFSAPSSLHWEYTSPYSYFFIYDGSRALSGDAENHQAMDASSSKVFRRIARIIDAMQLGRALQSPEDFETKVIEESSHWKVTLSPKRKEMQLLFAKFVLSFRKSDLVADEVTMVGRSDETTHIKLQNILVDQPIDQIRFRTE